MTSPNLGDLLVTTARHWSTKVADNVTNNNALLAYMNKRGNIKVNAGGGRTLEEYLMWGTNNSVQAYTDYDVFTPPTSDQEVIDAASYTPKQTGGFCSISGREESMNQGEYQRKDLLEARMNQLEANLQNNIAVQLFSNGTGSGGKDIGGLQLLVADTPSAAGTVGGINQVTYTWWRNYTSGSLTLGATTIQAAMNDAYLGTLRGKDQVDLILADRIMYNYYWTSLQTIQRITEVEKGVAGFRTLAFMGADVIFDVNCPSKRMYFINTSDLKFRYYPGRWFATGDKRTIQNADYVVVPMWIMGNLVTGRRASHGVIIDD